LPLKLQPASLDWALKHIETLGDTDIFPAPFEFQAIREWWNASPSPTGPKQRVVVRDWLASLDMLNWVARTPRRCLSPKHHFGFRASTQLDPLDSLIYTALVYELGIDLEAARVPASDGIVHSYRFSPDTDGRMFDQNFGYESFRAKSIELASDDECEWVVVADIADFYPRLYSHPLENALIAATKKTEHLTVIKKMLSSWNHSVSYGIPVGPAGSRLLAEVAIADVDAALMGESLRHVRFVDDFRIFTASERDAYSALAFLANTLFENHGLTLQQHKTYIQPAAAFLEANEAGESDKERQSLSDRFESILDKLGMSSWYEPINYDDLPEIIRADIDALNLIDLLGEHINASEPLDPLIVRFVLRRLSQLDDSSATDLVLKNMKRLYPVFKDAIGYVTAMRSLGGTDKHDVGLKLLDLIDDDVVGHLEYHRAWILSTFANDADWNNADRFIPIYNSYADPFTRRDITLALGRANKAEWFKAKKRNIGQLAHWEKRAFLAAASCLPGDEATHWYQSLAPQLDELEKVVVDWARRHPFS
jgi:hypothetical protein